MTEALNSDAPPQVRRAIGLFWLSFALAAAGAIAMGLMEAPDEEVGLLVAWGGTAAAYLVTAALIYAISRRQNWARFVLLFLTVVVLCGYGLMLGLGEFDEEPWWSNAITAVTMAIDVVAFYLLFFTEGSQWFGERGG